MKTFIFILLGICIVVNGCTAAARAEPKVLLAQSDISKIAQVKTGALKTAHASWWGFDKDDATETLQNAINSGVPKLVIDNTGNDWIINKPLNLVSSQEIVFSDGVVIQAKENSFRGLTDSMFVGRNLTDIILRGEGKAILRMRKTDYQDASRYKKAEWRSGISLYDCTNITLRNFTVTQTGGDGLYLGATENGYNKNILVEDMIFDDNHRQGISVISVDGFTVRNSKFINTIGTAPEAGIDFEPNQAGQRLVNCVIEDSVFANNKGDGIDIYAVHLTGDSLPISITVNRSVISGNVRGGLSSMVAKNSDNPATGNVTFNECHFEGNSILLANAIHGSVQYLFKNCMVDFRNPAENTETGQKSPIIFMTGSAVTHPIIDNIAFDNVTVTINNHQTSFGLDFWKGAEISEQVTGLLNIKQDGKNTKIALPGYLRENKKQLEVPASERLQKLITKLPRTQTDEEYQQMQEKIRVWEKAGSLKNSLVTHGDFSQATAAQHWSTWQASNSDGAIDFDDSIDRTKEDGRAAVLSGVFNGCFLQNIEIKPGGTYVVQGWIRRSGMGVGSLKAGWKDADNKWIDGTKGPVFYAPISDDPETSWQKVEGIVTAPENAKKLTFICGVQYQRFSEDKIWFDDVAVFEISNRH